MDMKTSPVGNLNDPGLLKTDALIGGDWLAGAARFDVNDPANISPLVVWLGSLESTGVTGRLFEVEGGIISLAEGWRHGPSRDKHARWEPAEIGPVVHDLIAAAKEPEPVYGVS